MCSECILSKIVLDLRAKGNNYPDIYEKCGSEQVMQLAESLIDLELWKGETCSET